MPMSLHCLWQILFGPYVTAVFFEPEQSELNIGRLNDTAVSLMAPLWLKVKCCGNLSGGNDVKVE